jgi:PAP2 superfamily
MIQKLLTLLLLITASQTSVMSQDKKPDAAREETPSEIKLEKKLSKHLYSLRQFGHETILFVKQPTKWHGADFLRLGIVAASTVAVMPFDERIVAAGQGGQQQFTNLAKIGTFYGEWYSIVGVAGAFGVYGLAAKDTTAKKISIELLQAGLYSELITVTLKVIVGRARPLADEGAFVYHPFSLDYNFQSMPSGHTTSAFALSTVMSRHAKTTVLKIAAYLPAGLTMFARIYQDKHWLSDEILGAAIGYFVGNWVVDLHSGKRHRINVTSISPIGLSYTFR